MLQAPADQFNTTPLTAWRASSTAENDVLQVRDGQVSAGAGDDLVFGDTGQETIAGEDGDDIIFAKEGADSLSGGNGNDTVRGGIDNDTLSGGAGNDMLSGGDLLSRPAGPPPPGTPASWLDGIDTADYRQAANGGIYDLAEQTSENRRNHVLIVTDDGDGGQDTLHSIEKILGTRRSDVVKFGDWVRDPQEGELRLAAFDGDEEDEDGKGDLLDFAELSAAVSFDAVSGIAGADVELKGFEAAVGTDFDDTITGDELRYVEGGEGADQIDTGAEGDTLYGGTADGDDDGASDSLAGGEGTDVYFAGADDIIRDTDGRGVIVFNDLILGGPIGGGTVGSHGETYTIDAGSWKVDRKKTGPNSWQDDYKFIQFDKPNIRVEVELSDGSKLVVEDFQNQDFGWTFIDSMEETWITESFPYTIQWLGTSYTLYWFTVSREDDDIIDVFMPDPDPTKFGNDTLIGSAGDGGGNLAAMATVMSDAAEPELAPSAAPLAGSTYLAGGRGSDEYEVYLRFSTPPEPGGEVIQVVEWSSQSDVDRIVLADAEAISTAVLVQRDESSLDDVLLSFVDAADSLLIKRQFLGFGYGAEEIVFGDSVWTGLDLQDAYIAQAQTAGADTIFGFSGDTVFRINVLAGSDVITENANDGSGDRLVLGLALVSTEARVAIGGATGEDAILSFVGASGGITLTDQFHGDGSGIEFIQFGDGVVWTSAQAHAAYVAQAQTAGNDVIYGAAGDTTFTIGSLAGADLLSEAPFRGGSDLLILSGSLTSSQVHVTRGATRPDDATLSFAGSPGSLTLTNQFAGDEAGVEQIRFADAVTWASADLKAAYFAQAQTSGNDTIVGFRGDTVLTVAALAGSDFITEAAAITGVDRLTFGSGLTSTTVLVNRSTLDSDDAVLTFTGKAGSLTLDGQFLADGTGFELFEFSDGVIWSREDLLAAYFSQTSQTPGDDTVLGAAGNTTYIYTTLAGNDVINEASYKGAADLLIFGGLLISTNAVLTRNPALPNNVTFQFIGQTGSLTLQNEFAGAEAGIERIRFADDVTWTIPDLRLAYFGQAQTPGADTILGFEVADSFAGGAGADSLRGYGGADTLAGGEGADRLRGDVGTDTYVFNLGDGEDTIYDNGSSSEIDTVQLGAGITTDDVAVTQADTGRDFVISFGNSPSDRIVLDDRITVAAAGADQLRFDDGTVWTYATLLLKSLVATTGGDTLYGDSADNTLAGAEGNDRLEGRGGSDTYLFQRGDGQDTIDDGTSGDVDTVELGGDIVWTEVTVSQADAGRDLVLTFSGSAGDRLVLDDRIPTASGGADVIRFADGTTWDYATLLQKSLVGTADADSLAGDDAANEIVGNAGADSLVGRGGNDTLAGGAGDDTLDGGSGDDLIVVAESSEGFDSVTGGSGSDTITAGTDGLIIGLRGVASIEAITGAGFAGVGISGNDAANTLNFSSVVLTDIVWLDGAGGNDALTGSGGNDRIIAGLGDDTLDGSAGDDTFLVSGTSDGFDSIIGGLGSDRIEATSNGATIGLRGLASVETVSGAGFASVIVVGSVSADNLNFSSTVLEGIAYLEGAAGNDTLVGSAGGDTFRVAGTGAGFDMVIGGEGSDRIEAGAIGTAIGLLTIDGVETITANGFAGVYIQGSSGADTLNFSGATLVDIERIDGGYGNDLIVGSAGADTLIGGPGNDTLDGGDGNDVFRVGGSGQGVDVIIGGAGEDRLEAASANTALSASLLDGVEIISSGGLSGVYVLGSAQDDTLDFSNTQFLGIDRIDAGTGSDTITGTAGADRILGGSGADRLDGGGGSDTASYATSALGVAVNLTLSLQAGSDAQGDELIGFENVAGSNSADTLIGDDGANVLSAAGGNDLLDGALGADTLDGGAGTDIVTYAGSASGVVVNLLSGSAIGGAAEGDSLLNIEQLIGTAFDDSLTGAGGSNLLDGAAGNDVLDGGSWSDTMIGGTGDDVFVVDSTSDQCIEFADEGSDEIRTALTSFTLGSNIERLTFTGSAAFTGTGNALANAIVGGGGNDLLQGGGGADTLVGGNGIDTASYVSSSGGVAVDLAAGLGTGADAEGDLLAGIENLTGSAYDDALTGSAAPNLLIGGTGADTIDGGAGVDTVSYAASAAGVTVNLTTGSGQGGHAEGDVLMNAEYLIGTSSADALTGSAGANHFDSGLGSDTLDGGGGADTMVGGGGDDIYFVDVASDVVTEASNGGSDEVRATASTYTLSTNIERLAFVGTGAFNGTGNTLANLMVGGGGNDTLAGSSGNDTLQGGDGADVLAGGTGQDALVGGVGADFFDFNLVTESAVGASTDFISDFSQADGDRIDLAGIDANTAVFADQAFSFIGTAAFVSGIRSQLRHENRADGNTWIQADLDGNLIVDFEICVSGMLTLSAADFVL